MRSHFTLVIRYSIDINSVDAVKYVIAKPNAGIRQWNKLTILNKSVLASRKLHYSPTRVVNRSVLRFVGCSKGHHWIFFHLDLDGFLNRYPKCPSPPNTHLGLRQPCIRSCYNKSKCSEAQLALSPKWALTASFKGHKRNFHGLEFVWLHFMSFRVTLQIDRWDSALFSVISLRNAIDLSIQLSACYSLKIRWLQNHSRCSSI